MSNFYRAELMKLGSGRSLLIAALAVGLFGVIATSVVILGAPETTTAGTSRQPSIAALSGAGGASEAFATGASFAGIFAFVLFTANIAGEFSQGTIRTLLIKRPSRFRLLLGKMTGLLSFVGAALAVALVLIVVLSFALAPAKDIATGEWLTLDGVQDALRDFGIVLFSAIAWSIFAMCLAVTFRSVAFALGVGVAWAGPIEHLTADVSHLDRWYPGLMLEALAAGGTNDVSFERALLLTTTYVLVAATFGVALFLRKDVTA